MTTSSASRKLSASAATAAEKLLWCELRARAIGPKWRRQHAIGPYIVDLYCPAARLVIELDGHQHGDDAHAAYDAARARFIERRGLRVVRFTNGDVLRRSDVVLDEIWRIVSG